MEEYCLLCWSDNKKATPISKCKVAHRTIEKTKLIEGIKYEIEFFSGYKNKTPIILKEIKILKTELAKLI